MELSTTKNNKEVAKNNKEVTKNNKEVTKNNKEVTKNNKEVTENNEVCTSSKYTKEDLYGNKITLRESIKNSDVKNNVLDQPSQNKLKKEDKRRTRKKRTSYDLQIVIFGDYGSGKTSLALCYRDGLTYSKSKSTICVDIIKKTVIVNENTSINIQIFDTAGQERYSSISDSIYRNKDYYIISHELKSQDCENKSNLKKLEKRMNDLIYKFGKEIKIVVVLTKKDLVSKEVELKWLNVYNSNQKILFVRSTTIYNIKSIIQLFKDIVLEFIECYNKKFAKEKFNFMDEMNWCNDKPSYQYNTLLNEDYRSHEDIPQSKTKCCY